MISFEDFKKVELRAGKILSAEKIPETDKLLKLSVDFGTRTRPVAHFVPIDPSLGLEVEPQLEKVSDIRQIVSGISSYFPDPQTLIGKTCMFCTNLEPRKIKGFESNGMIVAVSDNEGNFSLLETNSSIRPGTLAK